MKIWRWLTTITVGETDAGMPSQEHAGKDPDVAVSARGVTARMPSQRHVASSIFHGVQQSKEPPGLVILNYLHRVE